LDSSGYVDEAIDGFGICTSVFGHRHALTPAKLRQLEGTGLGWLEIGALQPQHLNVFDDEKVAELAEAAAETPLNVWSLHAPFCGLAMDDPDTREDGLRKLVQAARVAERLGAGIVVVHPGRDVPSVDRDREVEWTRDGVARALDVIPPRAILALETMGPSSIGGRAEEMLRILEGFDTARVGVCFDTGHVNTGACVADVIRALAGHLVSVHLHDNYGDRDAHDMPGEGNIDWPTVLAGLRRAGYRGPLMAECGWDGHSAAEIACEFVRRMARFAR